jgi:hypothetical protein
MSRHATATQEASLTRHKLLEPARLHCHQCRVDNICARPFFPLFLSLPHKRYMRLRTSVCIYAPSDPLFVQLRMSHSHAHYIDKGLITLITGDNQSRKISPLLVVSDVRMIPIR